MNTSLQFYILGTRINNLTKKEVLHKVGIFLKNNDFDYIVTVNPEIVLEAHGDDDYKKILNASSINIADGIGVKFASWKCGYMLKERYTGVALTWDALHIANEMKLSVYLIANKNGLSSWQEIRNVISKRYPNLQIDGENRCVSNYELPITNHQLLIANLGAPHQERLMNALKKSSETMPNLGIGVGGAFDYITGKIPRAPKCMRDIGLEWLYRLFKQPLRIKRIYYAVIVFPILVLINKK